MDKKNKTITISVSPELIKKIEDGKYNRSKLIDSLLSEHFKKENEKN
jgi:hypothetical protein